VVREIAPNASVEAILEAAGWPEGIASTVVVVGHQPTLGEVLATLLGNETNSDGSVRRSWAVKKSGVYWIKSRERNGDGEAVLMAAITPDLV
jgi:phosphohistidine phosphatase